MKSIMTTSRTLIPRNLAHKLSMILLIIYFRNYVDDRIYIYEGNAYEGYGNFGFKKANDQSCILDANIISEYIGE